MRPGYLGHGRARPGEAVVVVVVVVGAAVVVVVVVVGALVGASVGALVDALAGAPDVGGSVDILVGASVVGGSVAFSVVDATTTSSFWVDSRTARVSPTGQAMEGLGAARDTGEALTTHCATER